MRCHKYSGSDIIGTVHVLSYKVVLCHCYSGSEFTDILVVFAVIVGVMSYTVGVVSSIEGV